MFIIGINAFHPDSSACVIRDGVLIAAAEEERFRRIKHWSGFPTESIKCCLNEAGIKLEDVQHISLNQNPKANFFKKLYYLVKNPPKFEKLLPRLKNSFKRMNFSIKSRVRKFFLNNVF